MFDNLSNDDISTALDELITCFGVRMEWPFSDLLAMLRKKDAQGCMQTIAERLELPIRISLSYVPKGFRLGATDGFQSTSLSRTDYGTESTMAQVTIPANLPMFGTSGLQGYPIHVRVKEGAHEQPEAFVAVMTHELSHVLLRALRHPMMESELHTDLVPLLLGFRKVVERGRKIVHYTTSGNVTTTHTTTYGYLTDSHFIYACQRVEKILEGYLRRKKILVKSVTQLNRQLDMTEERIGSFWAYVRYLDSHPPRQMKQDDALLMVQIHTADYTHGWEIIMDKIRTSAEQAEEFVQALSLCMSRTNEKLEEHTKSLKLASEQLDQVEDDTMTDIRTMQRYVPFHYKLRNRQWLRWQCWSGKFRHSYK